MKKILFVFILIFTLILAGCGDNNTKEDENNTEENINQEENTSQEENVIKKKIENKDLIYTLYLEKNIDDELIEIPLINIDSEDVENINSSLNEIIEEVKQIRNDENENQHFRYYYNWYLNGSILSFILRYKDEYDESIKMIKNVDIYTGKELAIGDILKYKGITEEEFKNNLEDYYTKAFISKLNLNSVDDLKEIHMPAYENVIKNIPSDINELLIYLDEESTIHLLLSLKTEFGLSEDVKSEISI